MASVAPSGPPDLTPRERAVLQLIARGMTTRPIAEELGTSEYTVRVEVREIKDKLHVRSRAHAVAEAVRMGLIEP
jgi:DNA-binding NarL/FixJ family response regulator